MQITPLKHYKQIQPEVRVTLADMPPLSRTKSMEQSPLILENGEYEDHTIYRRADHRIPQAS
jgi:hypothetical protein